jgi:hypothetical protein
MKKETATNEFVFYERNFKLMRGVTRRWKKQGFLHKRIHRKEAAKGGSAGTSNGGMRKMTEKFEIFRRNAPECIRGRYQKLQKKEVWGKGGKLPRIFKAKPHHTR